MPKRKQTVYAIQTGSYSDVGFGPIFSTKALADRYVEEMEKVGDPYAYPEVVEYVLDEESGARAGFELMIDREGNIYDKWSGDDSLRPCMVGSVAYLTWVPWEDKNPTWLRGQVAGTKEKAIKVMNDRRAAIVAAGLWGDPRVLTELEISGNSQ